MGAAGCVPAPPPRERRFYGLRRSNEDHTKWTAFYDESSALNDDIDELIFGDSLEECVIQLEARFPASDHRLSRIVLNKHGTYVGTSYVNAENACILPEGEEYYRGLDHQTALALAKKYGSIVCDLRPSHYGRTERVDWETEGCRLDYGDTFHTCLSKIVYCPKLIFRARKAAETRAARAPVRCNTISNASWKMRTTMRMILPSLNYEMTTGSYSRYHVCYVMMETIKYFGALFGKHSYRKHPAFRELKTEWKRRAAASRKAFYPKNEDAMRYDTIMAKFCNFMDTEIRVRNGKLNKEEWEDWHPTVHLSTFEEFEPKRYEKILKAREKEEKRKAKAKVKAKAAARRRRIKTARRKAVSAKARRSNARKS